MINLGAEFALSRTHETPLARRLAGGASSIFGEFRVQNGMSSCRRYDLASSDEESCVAREKRSYPRLSLSLIFLSRTSLPGMDDKVLSVPLSVSKRARPLHARAQRSPGDSILTHRRSPTYYQPGLIPSHVPQRFWQQRPLISLPERLTRTLPLARQRNN